MSYETKERIAAAVLSLLFLGAVALHYALGPWGFYRAVPEAEEAARRLVGLGYYYVVGCSTGSCAITSNPIITMIYMGVIGLLLSGLFGKGCDGKCNM